MQLKTAVGAFFVEFSSFETQSVGMALRSLSKDAVFVQQTERLLDLEGRLTLLNRMALARGISPIVMAELDACLLRARKLRDQRDEVARNMMNLEGSAPRAPKPLRVRRTNFAQLEQLWMPGLAQIQMLTTESVELQEWLRTIVRKIEQETAIEQVA
jgi:hypothetical protein